MFSHCLSCGAPAPSNSSLFSFVCDFCGAKNVDEEYFKKKQISSSDNKANNLFESALTNINAGDYKEAEKLLEKSNIEQSGNQETIIYLALCKSANAKASNYEKNIEIIKELLNKAKLIDELNEDFQYGQVLVTNMLLGKAFAAAKYFFETSEKKYFAFGDGAEIKKSCFEEISRGTIILDNTYALNPTDTLSYSDSLLSAVNELERLGKHIKIYNLLEPKIQHYIELLFDLYVKHKEIVSNVLLTNPIGVTLINDFNERLKPKSEISIENKISPPRNVSFVYIVIGVFIVLSVAIYFFNTSSKSNSNSTNNHEVTKEATLEDKNKLTNESKNNSNSTDNLIGKKFDDVKDYLKEQKYYYSSVIGFQKEHVILIVEYSEGVNIVKALRSYPGTELSQEIIEEKSVEKLVNIISNNGWINLNEHRILTTLDKNNDIEYLVIKINKDNGDIQKVIKLVN